MKHLIIFGLAFAFVGLCFYYYKGGHLIDPPKAAASSVHARSSATIRDINGRMWKCTGTGSNRSCKPQDGLSSR